MPHMLQQSFSRGQISGRALGLTGAEEYRAGCLRLWHAVLTRLGAARKRSGLQFMGQTKGAQPARLVPFDGLGVGPVCLEITDGALRVWKPDGTLVDLGSGTELAAPWSESEALSLQYAQTEDRLFLVVGTKAPQVLQFEDDVWSFGPHDTSGTGILVEEYSLETVITTEDTDPGNPPNPDRITTEDPFFSPADDDAFWRLGLHAWVQSIDFGHSARMGIRLTTLAPDPAGEQFATYGGPFRTIGPFDVSVTIQTSTAEADSRVTLTGLPGRFGGRTGWLLDPDQQGSHSTDAGAWMVQILQVNADGSQAECQVLNLTAGDGTVIPMTAGVTTNKIQFYEPSNPERGDDWIQPSAGSGSDLELYSGAARWKPEDVGREVYLNGGVVRIDEYVSANVVRGTSLRDLRVVWSTWDYGIGWGGAAGYPSAVTIHQQRLWYGGLSGAPSTVYGSKTAKLEDFRLGDEDDDDGLSLKLVSNRANAVVWMVSGADHGEQGDDVLAIGTTDAEFVVRGLPITPTNLGASIKTRYGARRVMPESLEGSLVFVQRSGVSARQFLLQDNTSAFLDLTDWSDDLFDAAIREFAFVRDPDALLFTVLESGSVRVLTYRPTRGVLGWSAWPGLSCVSVASVPLDAGDEAWMCVARENGYGIEVYRPGQWIDSWSTATVVGAQVSGLERFEGQTVVVLQDGELVGQFPVSGGMISTGAIEGQVTVGLPVGLVLHPIFAEYFDTRGVTPGRQKRVNAAKVRLYQSRGGSLAGSELPPRSVLTSGWLEAVGFARLAELPIVEVESDDPYPFEVLAVRADVTQGSE